MVVSSAAVLQFLLLACGLSNVVVLAQASNVVEAVIMPQMENMENLVDNTLDSSTSTSTNASSSMKSIIPDDPILKPEFLHSRHTAQSLERARAQIQWLVHDQGGFFASELIQLEPLQNVSASVPMKHKGTPLGFFALQDIPKDTVLMKIPRKAILKAGAFCYMVVGLSLLSVNCSHSLFVVSSFSWQTRTTPMTLATWHKSFLQSAAREMNPTGRLIFHTCTKMRMKLLPFHPRGPPRGERL